MGCMVAFMSLSPAFLFGRLHIHIWTTLEGHDATYSMLQHLSHCMHATTQGFRFPHPHLPAPSMSWSLLCLVARLTCVSYLPACCSGGYTDFLLVLVPVPATFAVTHPTHSATTFALEPEGWSLLSPTCLSSPSLQRSTGQDAGMASYSAGTISLPTATLYAPLAGAGGNSAAFSSQQHAFRATPQKTAHGIRATRRFRLCFKQRAANACCAAAHAGVRIRLARRRQTMYLCSVVVAWFASL